MARRIAVALVVALFIALAAVYVAYKKIAHTSHPVVQPPLKYVAAAHPVEPGEVLRPQDLTMINWPSSNPLNGSFVHVQDVVGRATLYPLAAGEPVLDRQLIAPGSGVGLTARIPKGMRAIALRSDEIVGVAGFLMPGAHVDVLVTYRENNQPNPITATVLQNVEVLAVGHQIQPDPSGKPINVNVVTLLLSPRNAEKAVLAAAQGSIHFVLRNGRDEANSKAPPIDVQELAGAAIPAKGYPRREPLKPPPPKPWVVQTWLGNKVTSASFN